jgi:hypothetical protein
MKKIKTIYEGNNDKVAIYVEKPSSIFVIVVVIVTFSLCVVVLLVGTAQKRTA